MINREELSIKENQTFLARLKLIVLKHECRGVADGRVIILNMGVATC